jgi:ribA/ribD-fused uncharacterized protein
MLTKALMMKDFTTFELIIQSKTPSNTKKLGRKVSPWNQKLWDQNLELIIDHILLQKFSSNPSYAKVLLDTNEYILVEASPTDCILGVGLSITDPAIYNISKWRGLNILGYSLMRVRELINA